MSRRESETCTCVVCGRRYEYDRRKGHTRVRCNSCANRGTRAARRALKQQMVDYKGGRCGSCGFSGSLAALSFHHRDPETKTLTLAGSHGRSWDVLRDELDKCELLCLNCHFELHARAERRGRRETRPTSPVDPEKLRRCTTCGREYIHDWRQGQRNDSR